MHSHCEYYVNVIIIIIFIRTIQYNTGQSKNHLNTVQCIVVVNIFLVTLITYCDLLVCARLIYWTMHHVSCNDVFGVHIILAILKS